MNVIVFKINQFIISYYILQNNIYISIFHIWIYEELFNNHVIRLIILNVCLFKIDNNLHVKRLQKLWST